MMKSSRMGIILSIVAILCFIFVGTGKAISAEITIRIGSAFLKGHILVDASEKFKELIEGASGGRIAVQLQLGGKSEEEIVNLNSAGAFEIQSNGTQFLQLKAPTYFTKDLGRVSLSQRNPVAILSLFGIFCSNAVYR